MTATTEAGRRVAVVAGMARGLGAAIAETFVRVGYVVAGISRTDELGRRMERSLAGYRHFVCDVTDPPRVADVVGEIDGELGAPSVLVYDPMRLVVKPFEELTPDEFESVWRVTCFGAMVVARATLPYLLKTCGGTIVFTGATAAVKGGPRFTSLASAKFALRGLAQSLAREFGPRGVHVVHAVVDGLIWSPQTRERFNPEREKCIDPAAIAKTYLDLVSQHPSAWTHEIDLRPMHERF